MKLGDFVRYLINGCENFMENNLFEITNPNVSRNMVRFAMWRIDNDICGCNFCIDYNETNIYVDGKLVQLV
jgi:hypothetical protein